MRNFSKAARVPRKADGYRREGESERGEGEGVPVEVGSILAHAESVLIEGESGRGDLGGERNEEYCRPRDMFLVLDVRIAQ